jgi:hypothetical protein
MDKELYPKAQELIITAAGGASNGSWVRLFSYLNMNWRGKPLVSHETIVSLIAATTTQKRFEGEGRT